MTYAPPTVPLSASWVGAAAYSGSSSIIYAHWAGGDYITPAGNNELTFGAPFVTKQQFASHVGFDSAAFSPALVARGTDYIPPFWNLDARWAGAAQYEPPAMPLLVTWDSGPKVSQYVVAEPIYSLEMGEPNAVWAQIITPVGADGCIVGAPVVRPPPLNASWYGANEYTPPVLELWARWGAALDGRVYANSWQSGIVGIGLSLRNQRTRIDGAGSIPPGNRYGSPSVWLYTRYLKPDGVDTQAHGSQWASHWLRYLTAVGMGDKTARGTPWVSRSPRDLAPAGFDAMKMLESHVVGGTRTIAPVGTEMTEWGTRIIPESRTLYAEGKPMQAFGEHDLKNHISYVKPLGFNTQPDEALRFGYQYIWNLRQIVQQVYDPNDGLNPPEIRGWMVVEHRDKFPRAFGWTSSRHGYTFIWNKASAMLPGGIAAPEHPPYYKAGSVTHWVRALAPEELDSLHMGRWGAVYNTADLLRAGIGPDALGFGEPLLENRSRKFDHFGDIDSLGLGEHLVADRVRGIEFEQRYSIHPPVIELPDVRLHTRYFENASVGSWQRVGLAELRIHWTIIETRWSFHPPAFIGMPELRNLTPELGTMGANSEEFGDAAVRTQWREVMTFDGYMTRFGTNIVRDRTHQVMLVTLGPPPAMLPGPVVTKIGGLPEEQRILARPVNFPSASPLIVVGNPSTNQLSSHVQGFDAVRWGASAVALMGAEGAGNIYSLEMQHEYDVVHHVTLRIRELGVEGIPRLPSSFGAPALSPHTIYAVVEAPMQAVENHPQPLRPLHYVDGYVNEDEYEPKGVGDRTKVTHRVQYVSPRWSAGSNLLGLPTIRNMKNWVQVDGIRSMRFGLPSTPLDLESEQLDPEDGVVVPKPIVSRPEPLHRELRAQGFSGAVGAQLVEFFHRPVYPSGFDDLLVGTRKLNDKPFQWQGLRVGPHVDNIIGGYLTEEWGTAWVSLAIRGLSVPGLDSLGAGFDPDMFKARMRVSLGTKSLGPSSQEVVCGAGETFGGGLPFVSNMAHYILPDGNSEQYRKGAQSA